METFYQERIKYGDLVYLEILDKENSTNILSSNNISFQSKASIQIINKSSPNYLNYEDHLFIVFPSLSEKCFNFKKGLETNYNKLKEKQFENDIDVEYRNKVMDSLKSTKNEIYDQNLDINEKIGKPIKYSHKVLFVHLKSEMYLSCQDLTTNNSKVCLIDQCSEDCVFLFWPYNKYDSISDDVFTNQNLLIRKSDKNIWSTNPFITFTEIDNKNNYHFSHTNKENNNDERVENNNNNEDRNNYDEKRQHNDRDLSFNVNLNDVLLSSKSNFGQTVGYKIETGDVGNLIKNSKANKTTGIIRKEGFNNKKNIIQSSLNLNNKNEKNNNNNNTSNNDNNNTNTNPIFGSNVYNQTSVSNDTFMSHDLVKLESSIIYNNPNTKNKRESKANVNNNKYNKNSETKLNKSLHLNITDDISQAKPFRIRISSNYIDSSSQNLSFRNLIALRFNLSEKSLVNFTYNNNINNTALDEFNNLEEAYISDSNKKLYTTNLKKTSNLVFKIKVNHADDEDKRSHSNTNTNNMILNSENNKSSFRNIQSVNNKKLTSPIKSSFVNNLINSNISKKISESERQKHRSRFNSSSSFNNDNSKTNKTDKKNKKKKDYSPNFIDNASKKSRSSSNRSRKNIDEFPLPHFPSANNKDSNNNKKITDKSFKYKSNKNLFSNFFNEEIYNNIMIFTRIINNKSLGNFNLLSLFKPEPLELQKRLQEEVKTKISPYIEYNQIIRLKHVITDKYLSFKKENYSELTSEAKIVGIGSCKTYGFLGLKAQADDSCEWSFMESYIILDTENYEKNKLEGLSQEKKKNNNYKIKVVKKQDILRLFHIKTRKFVSEQDINDLFSFDNSDNKANMKKNAVTNNLFSYNNNKNKSKAEDIKDSKNIVIVNKKANQHTGLFKKNKTDLLSNQLMSNFQEHIAKFCFTLNMKPFDNDLIKINCVNENYSWEINLVIHFSENYLELVDECVNSNINKYLKGLDEYQKEFEKTNNYNDNSNINNNKYNKLKIKDFSGFNKHNNDYNNNNNYNNDNIPFHIDSLNSLSKEVKNITKIKRNWMFLKLFYQELKDYCLNQFSKRYEATIPLGKPVGYRQEMLKEQGFLEITFNFLKMIKTIKKDQEFFFSLFDRFKKTHNPVNRKVHLSNKDKEASNELLIINNFRSSITNNNNNINNNYNDSNNNNISKQETFKIYKEMFEGLFLLFTEITSCISQCFGFIECMCKSNSDSRNFVFKNRNIFNDYILKYKEAAKCIIDIIKDDEKFMTEIIHENIQQQFLQQKEQQYYEGFNVNNYNNTHKNIYDSHSNKTHSTNTILNNNTNNINKEKPGKNYNKNNLIDSIIFYLTQNSEKYDRYTLSLLSKLMKGENKGITSNQEYIFNLLIVQEQNNFLLKIQPKFNDTMFYVIYKNEYNQSDCKSLIELSTNTSKLTEHEKKVLLYLASQLNLIADMCYGRNYVCINKIRTLFPLDHLIHHIANIDIQEEVLGALINILNSCYIDVQPHFKKEFPEMIKIINNDLSIETRKQSVYGSFSTGGSGSDGCSIGIPRDRMNLILCISLFILYSIKFGKIRVNQNNIVLLLNLLGFQLYEKVDYNIMDRFDHDVYGSNNNENREIHMKNRLSLREEVKRVIHNSDPINKKLLLRNDSNEYHDNNVNNNYNNINSEYHYINNINSEKNANNNNNLKSGNRTKITDNNSKTDINNNSSSLSNNNIEDLLQHINNKNSSKSFYQLIGYKFLEVRYTTSNINIGTEFLVCIITFINDFLLDKVVLENIDNNVQNMRILAQTFKPFSKQDIISMNNINYLLKFISEIKVIFSSNNNNKDSGNNDENIIKTIHTSENRDTANQINNNNTDNNDLNRVLHKHIHNKTKASSYSLELYLPIIKQFSNLINYILTIKVNENLNSIIIKLLEKSTKIILENKIEDNGNNSNFSRLFNRIINNNNNDNKDIENNDKEGSYLETNNDSVSISNINNENNKKSNDIKNINANNNESLEPHDINYYEKYSLKKTRSNYSICLDKLLQESESKLESFIINSKNHLFQIFNVVKSDKSFNYYNITALKSLIEIIIKIIENNIDSSLNKCLIKILVKLCSQRKETLNALKNVQLISGEKRIKKYREFCFLINELQLSSEKTELWLKPEFTATISTHSNDLRENNNKCILNKLNKPNDLQNRDLLNKLTNYNVSENLVNNNNIPIMKNKFSTKQTHIRKFSKGNRKQTTFYQEDNYLEDVNTNLYKSNTKINELINPSNIGLHSNEISNNNFNKITPITNSFQEAESKLNKILVIFLHNIDDPFSYKLKPSEFTINQTICISMNLHNTVFLYLNEICQVYPTKLIEDSINSESSDLIDKNNNSKNNNYKYSDNQSNPALFDFKLKLDSIIKKLFTILNCIVHENLHFQELIQNELLEYRYNSYLFNLGYIDLISDIIRYNSKMAIENYDLIMNLIKVECSSKRISSVFDRIRFIENSFEESLKESIIVEEEIKETFDDNNKETMIKIKTYKENSMVYNSDYDENRDNIDNEESINEDNEEESKDCENNEICDSQDIIYKESIEDSQLSNTNNPANSKNTINTLSIKNKNSRNNINNTINESKQEISKDDNDNDKTILNNNKINMSIFKELENTMNNNNNTTEINNLSNNLINKFTYIKSKQQSQKSKFSSTLKINSTKKALNIDSNNNNTRLKKTNNLVSLNEFKENYINKYLNYDDNYRVFTMHINMRNHYNKKKSDHDFLKDENLNESIINESLLEELVEKDNKNDVIKNNMNILNQINHNAFIQETPHSRTKLSFKLKNPTYKEKASKLLKKIVHKNNQNNLMQVQKSFSKNKLFRNYNNNNKTQHDERSMTSKSSNNINNNDNNSLNTSNKGEINDLDNIFNIISFEKLKEDLFLIEKLFILINTLILKFKDENFLIIMTKLLETMLKITDESDYSIANYNSLIKKYKENNNCCNDDDNVSDSQNSSYYSKLNRDKQEYLKHLKKLINCFRIISYLKLKILKEFLKFSIKLYEINPKVKVLIKNFISNKILEHRIMSLEYKEDLYDYDEHEENSNSNDYDGNSYNKDRNRNISIDNIQLNSINVIFKIKKYACQIINQTYSNKDLKEVVFIHNLFHIFNKDIGKYNTTREALLLPNITISKIDINNINNEAIQIEPKVFLKELNSSAFQYFFTAVFNTILLLSEKIQSSNFKNHGLFIKTCSKLSVIIEKLREVFFLVIHTKEIYFLEKQSEKEIFVFIINNYKELIEIFGEFDLIINKNLVKNENNDNVFRINKRNIMFGIEEINLCNRLGSTGILNIDDISSDEDGVVLDKKKIDNFNMLSKVYSKNNMVNVGIKSSINNKNINLKISKTKTLNLDEIRIENCAFHNEQRNLISNNNDIIKENHGDVYHAKNKYIKNRGNEEYDSTNSDNILKFSNNQSKEVKDSEIDTLKNQNYYESNNNSKSNSNSGHRKPANIYSYNLSSEDNTYKTNSKNNSSSSNISDGYIFPNKLNNNDEKKYNRRIHFNNHITNNQEQELSTIIEEPVIFKIEIYISKSIIDLTQDFLSDFINFPFAQEYEDSELEIFSTRIKNQVDFQLILSSFFKNNSSLSMMNSIQQSATPAHFFFIIFNFIQNNYTNPKYYKEIISLIKLCSFFILNKPEYLVKTKSSAKVNFYYKTKLKQITDFCFSFVQKQFLENGSVEILLQIAFENIHGFNQVVLSSVLEFFINVMENNNSEAQEKIWELCNFLDSENLFYYLKTLFEYDIYIFLRNDTKIVSIKESKDNLSFILRVLKFLKNFTEGHNTKTQAYVREQINNKLSYNFIVIIVEYLIMLIAKLSHVLEKSEEEPSSEFIQLYYERIIQCLETLCEFIQGPCRENQEVMMSSKIFEIVDKVLRETEFSGIKTKTNEKLSEYRGNKEDLNEYRNNLENIEEQKDIYDINNELENEYYDSDEDQEMNQNTSNKRVNKLRTTTIKELEELEGYFKQNNEEMLEESIYPRGNTYSNNKSFASMRDVDYNKLNTNNHNNPYESEKLVNNKATLRSNYLNTHTNRNLTTINNNSLNVVKNNQINKSISRTVTNQYSNYTLLSEYSLNQSLNKKRNSQQKLFFKLKDYDKSMLIYKISLLLNALIEGQRFKSELIKKLIRDFDFMLFYDKLAEIYKKIISIYGKNGPMEFFLYEPHLASPNKIIIETGITLYSFLATLYTFQNKDSEFSRFFKEITEKDYNNKLTPQQNKNFKSNLKLIRKSINYFKENSYFIEVIKDDKIEKVFFPKLNYFDLLSDTMLLEFREKANRTSIQTKINSIFAEKDSIYYQLKQIEKIGVFFSKFGVLSFFFNNPKFFQYLAFYLSVIMNLLILFGYTVENIDYSTEEEYMDLRMKNINLFFNLSTNLSRSICSIIGVSLIFCSAMVFTDFITRKAPLIYRSYLKTYYSVIYEEKAKTMNELESGRVYNSFKVDKYKDFKEKARIIFILLSKIEIVYEVGYIFFALLAFGIHYFFFAYHLIEFIRSQPVLTNVLMSVYKSRVQLFFTFVFFMVLIYFYSLIFYYFFYYDFPPYTCDSVFMCMATVFQNTMADNMYQVLASGSDNNNEGRFSRFLVEISFTIILVWLVFQIVPGLIVDTFSTLRKNLEEFMDDMNNVCFICGMEREEIEKIYVGKSGFGDHLLDHNLKNYFCFLFYLKEKNPIELTGVESYVKDLVDNQIGSWIPSEDCLKREIMKMNN